jgi:LuxR family maltose regulon positive regulatory protein
MSIGKKLNTKTLYFTDKLKEKFSTFLKYPCTVVEAPMGYGKTTAVKKALSLIEANCVWQSIYDSGIVEFWSGFCHAISKIDKNCALKLEKMGMPVDSFMKRKAMMIIEEMSVPNVSYIVIDDYHFVKSEEVDNFLELFIRNMPEDLQLIIITRTSFLDNSIELQLKGVINHIGTNILEFEQNDITNYYRLCGISLTEEEKVQLCNRSEGWISALYLFALDYELHGSLVLNRNIPELVYNTVYEPLSDYVKKFLKAICLFDTFNIEKAQYMWQKEDTKALLKQLVQCNAFISQDIVTGDYSFHNIFTNCIREEFAQQSEAKQKETWLRMGEIYFQNKEYMHAIKCFYEAKDFHGIFSVIDEDKGRAFYYEHKELWVKYYKECPMEVKMQRLTAVLSYAQNLSTHSKYKEAFEEACSEFLQCLELNKNLPQEEHNQLQGEYIMLLSFKDYNDIFKLSEHNEKAYKLLREPSRCINLGNNWTFTSPSVLYLYYRESGKLEKIIQLMRTSINYYELNTNGHGRGSTSVFEAEWYYYRGDFENAEITVLKGISMAKKKGQLDVMVCGLFLQARIALIQGDFTRVLELIKKINEEVNLANEFRLEHTVGICEAYIYGCLEQPNKIPEWVYQGEYRRYMLFPGVGFANIVSGKALLLKKNPINLLSATEEFIKDASVFPNMLADMYIHIYRAIAKYQLNRIDDSVFELKQALDIAMPDKVILPFIENARELSSVFKDLLQDDTYLEFIKKVMVFYEKYDQAIEKIKENYFSEVPPKLTKREKEIALLVIQGLNNKEIGSVLHSSPNTVKFQLKNIFNKLNIKSRVLLTKEMIS